MAATTRATILAYSATSTALYMNVVGTVTPRARLAAEKRSRSRSYENLEILTIVSKQIVSEKSEVV